MKNKLILFLTLFLFSALSGHAFGSVFVDCGTQPNPDEGSFENVVFSVSSEDDDFSGPAGKNWHLTVNGKDVVGQSATAKIDLDPRSRLTVLTVLVQIGNSASGPVGTEYRVGNPYTDEPKLEIFNMGGFTGRIRTATYACFATTD